jgi:hypothetical protein
MQFLLNFYTAVLLKINDISFQYRLFTINFLSETSYNQSPLDYVNDSSAVWSEDQIYFIFGTGPLILSAIGLRLLFSLNSSARKGWKSRLALTWLAFLMVNALPCGIVAGALFYDSFGIAFQWMLGSDIFRVMIALGVLLLLVLFSRFWQWLFLNAAYSTAFLKDEIHQRIFLKNVYVKPALWGLAILMLFNWPFGNLYWPAFLLALVAVPALNQSLRYQAVYIEKSEKMIFTSRSQVLWFIAALALTWAAGFVKINF